MKALFLSLMMTIMLSSAAMAAIDFYEFDNSQQEQQFKELSNTLRCPKCQNNSIADSNAELAKDLRQKVYEMTKEGKSEQEIIDYMTARYGSFVTYNPPLTFATAILWLGPLTVLVCGFSFIVIRSRRNRKVQAGSTSWDADKEARLKSLLGNNDNGDKQK